MPDIMLTSFPFQILNKYILLMKIEVDIVIVGYCDANPCHAELI